LIPQTASATPEAATATATAISKAQLRRRTVSHYDRPARPRILLTKDLPIVRTDEARRHSDGMPGSGMTT
jgi:hypothetical protein